MTEILLGDKVGSLRATLPLPHATAIAVAVLVFMDCKSPFIFYSESSRRATRESPREVPFLSLWRREYTTEGGRLDWHHPERNGTILEQRLDFWNN